MNLSILKKILLIIFLLFFSKNSFSLTIGQMQDKAKEYENKNQIINAIKIYNEIIKNFPDSLLLSQIYLKKASLEKKISKDTASSTLINCLIFSKKDIFRKQAVSELIELNFSVNNESIIYEIEKIFNTIFSDKNKIIEYKQFLYFKVYEKSSNQDIASSIKYLKKIVNLKKKNINYFNALYYLIEIYNKQKKFLKSEEILKSALNELKSYENKEIIHRFDYLAGKVYFKLADYDKALDYCFSAFQYYKNKSFEDEVLLLIAQIYKNKNSPETALLNLEKIIYGSNNFLIKQKAMFEAGKIYFEEKNYDKSIAMFFKLTSYFSYKKKSYEYISDILSIYMKENYYDKFLQNIKQINDLEYIPDTLLFEAGKRLFIENNLDESLLFFKNIKNKKTYRTGSFISKIYFKQKDIKKCLDALYSIKYADINSNRKLTNTYSKYYPLPLFENFFYNVLTKGLAGFSPENIKVYPSILLEDAQYFENQKFDKNLTNNEKSIALVLAGYCLFPSKESLKIFENSENNSLNELNNIINMGINLNNLYLKNKKNISFISDNFNFLYDLYTIYINLNDLNKSGEITYTAIKSYRDTKKINLLKLIRAYILLQQNKFEESKLNFNSISNNNDPAIKNFTYIGLLRVYYDNSDVILFNKLSKQLEEEIDFPYKSLIEKYKLLLK